LVDTDAAVVTLDRSDTNTRVPSVAVESAVAGVRGPAAGTDASARDAAPVAVVDADAPGDPLVYVFTEDREGLVDATRAVLDTL